MLEEFLIIKKYKYLYLIYKFLGNIFEKKSYNFITFLYKNIHFQIILIMIVLFQLIKIVYMQYFVISFLIFVYFSDLLSSSHVSIHDPVLPFIPLLLYFIHLISFLLHLIP
jgi:hypothetical protein